MKFVIYSKAGCPYCVKVKEVLRRINVEHSVKTLGQDYSREDFYLTFGEGSTFPQILVDDNKIGGCVETIKFLREQKLL
jgi:glutaredoxin|tara:strand:- start:978 stop:1214 length:237 start_codon:yes stop_codon:yes gene_type:complete